MRCGHFVDHFVTESGEPPRKQQRLQFTLADGEARTTVEEGEGTLVINTTDAQQVTHCFPSVALLLRHYCTDQCA